MTHLAWMCWTYVAMVRQKATLADLRRVVATYLPVYAAWAAIVAFVIVFAVGYIGGRAAMPAFRAAAGDIPLQEVDSSGEVSIVALRADLVSAVDGAGALMAASGAVEGRFLLDRVESLVNGLFLPSDDEPEAIDLHVRLTGDDAALTIKADQIGRGESRTDGMTVVMTSDGSMFNPTPGMCTLSLDDFGFTTIQRPWGKASIPWYVGTLTCVEVPELRTDQTVSFTAVFESRSH